MRIYIIFLMFSCCFNFAVADSTPPTPPPDPDPGVACGHDGNPKDYHAIVSILKTSIGKESSNGKARICDNIGRDDKGEFGRYGAVAKYDTPSNSSYFKTRINLKNLTVGSRNSNYLQFIEISSALDTNNLPSIKDMLVQAVIVNNGDSQYKLQINYQTANKSESVSINLSPEYTEFDVTIGLITNGCIHESSSCNNFLGQIDVRVNYQKSSFDQFIILKDLMFNVIDTAAKTPIINTVFWGELDVQQFSGNIILNKPL